MGESICEYTHGETQDRRTRRVGFFDDRGGGEMNYYGGWIGWMDGLS